MFICPTSHLVPPYLYTIKKEARKQEGSKKEARKEVRKKQESKEDYSTHLSQFCKNHSAVLGLHSKRNRTQYTCE